MRAHRFVWLAAYALLTSVGFGVTVHWPTETLFAMFLSGTFLVGMTTLQYNFCALDDSTDGPGRRLLSNLATNAVFGGTATVAFSGLAELGAWPRVAALRCRGDRLIHGQTES